MCVLLGEELLGDIVEANALFFVIAGLDGIRTVRRRSLARAIRMRVVRVPCLLIAAQLI